MSASAIDEQAIFVVVSKDNSILVSNYSFNGRHINGEELGFRVVEWHINHRVAKSYQMKS